MRSDAGIALQGPITQVVATCSYLQFMQLFAKPICSRWLLSASISEARGTSHGTSKRVGRPMGRPMGSLVGRPMEMSMGRPMGRPGNVP